MGLEKRWSQSRVREIGIKVNVELISSAHVQRPSGSNLENKTKDTFERRVEIRKVLEAVSGSTQKGVDPLTRHKYS